MWLFYSPTPSLRGMIRRLLFYPKFFAYYSTKETRADTSNVLVPTNPKYCLLIIEIAEKSYRDICSCLLFSLLSLLSGLKGGATAKARLTSRPCMVLKCHVLKDGKISKIYQITKK